MFSKIQTNNKTASISKVIFFLIILSLPFLILIFFSYFLGVKTDLGGKLSELKLAEQPNEDFVSPELLDKEKSSEQDNSAKITFPVGYNGTVISGPVVDVNQNDYKILHQKSINAQFWAKPYFIANDQVYYAEPNASVVISRLLEGVDASSFGMLFSVGYPYANDKSGIICKGRRADHIDKNTFNLIGNQSQGSNSYGYGRDKNNIIRNCLILNGVDVDTFKIVKPNIVQDKNGLYSRKLPRMLVIGETSRYTRK